MHTQTFKLNICFSIYTYSEHHSEEVFSCSPRSWCDHLSSSLRCIWSDLIEESISSGQGLWLSPVLYLPITAAADCVWLLLCCSFGFGWVCSSCFRAFVSVSFDVGLGSERRNQILWPFVAWSDDSGAWQHSKMTFLVGHVTCNSEVIGVCLYCLLCFASS